MLTCSETIGVSVAIIGVLIIGLGGAPQGEIELPVENAERVTIWLPLALQVLAIAMFVTRSVLLKKLVMERNFFPPVFTFLNTLLLQSILCCVALGHFIAYGVVWMDVLEGFCGGFVLTLGVSMLQYGTSKGRGGPANALSNFSMIL